MEHEFTKQEILGLYLNVIFLGQRAYGVAAAAETYFGKTLDQARRSPRRPRSPACPRRPRATTRSSIRSWPPRAAPTCCGACRSSATSMRRPRRPPTRSRSQARAHAPAVSTSRRPYVAEMARLEVRQRFGADGRERRLQGLHDDRRPAADGGQPRRAHRTDRVRPPPRLARPGRARRARPPTPTPRLRGCWSTSTRASATCRRRSSCRSRDRTARVYVQARSASRRSTGTGCPGRASELHDEALGPAAEERRRGARARRCRLRGRRQQRARAAGAAARGAERAGGARSERRRDRRRWSAASTTSPTSTTA